MTQGERLARFAGQVRASSLRRFEQIEPEDRCWRPAPEVMSFADHLAHLVDCDRWLLNRLREEPTRPAIGQVGMADGTTWDDDLTALAVLGEERAELIARMSDDDIARPVDLPPQLDCADVGALVLRGILDHELNVRWSCSIQLRLSQGGPSPRES